MIKILLILVANLVLFNFQLISDQYQETEERIVLNSDIESQTTINYDQEEKILNLTEEELNNNQKSIPVKIIKNPNIQNHPIKFCTDLSPITNLFKTQIEPFYTPLIDLLPEPYQIILQEETQYARLNFASCILCSTLVLFVLLSFYLIKTKINKTQLKVKLDLTEELVYLKLKLSEYKLKESSFENVIFDLESKLGLNESKLKQYELKVNDSDEKVFNLMSQNESNSIELEKLKSNETKLNKEMNKLKLELNELEEKYTSQVTYLAQIENKSNQTQFELEQKLSEIEDLKANETKLKQNLFLLETSSKMNLNESNLDSISLINDLKTQIQHLEVDLNKLKYENDLKNTEILNLNDKLTFIEKVNKDFETKKTEYERLINEKDMKISLLNELRDKDTKAHIKQLTEMDSQLKKKTLDSDKISHLYDQLRAKQERIHDLETQMSRVEKQSNQERQTYEKQAHENWLNSKKLDKELKETKLELSSLKEKFNDLLAETNLIKSKFYLNNSQLDNSELNDSRNTATTADQPLQIETTESRPSSATSSGSGINSGIGGPLMPQHPFGFVRPPVRYPFPMPPMNLSSPNALAYTQHQQMMYKMMLQQQQSKSANSSQLPSPGAGYFNSSLTNSASFPNNTSLLNDSSSSFVSTINAQNENTSNEEKNENC